MMNPFAEVNWKPDVGEKRKFAFSLIIGFPCLALVFATMGRIASGGWNGKFVWLAVIGALAGGVLWLIPQIAKPFYLAWYFVACCIGFVVGNILLSAVYYLVVTPIGLLVRASGRGAIRRNLDRTSDSYWREAETVVDLTRYYRQF